MTDLEVRPGILDTVHEQLDAGARDLTSTIDGYQISINIMRGGWTGDASDIAYGSHRRWDNDMRMLISDLERISQITNQAASTYEEAEQKVVSIWAF